MRSSRVQIFGQHEPQTLAQLETVAARAERTALMADGHLGYVMPIGGVAAYQNAVSVVAVGFDIACGNCAIRTNQRVDLVADPPLSDRWHGLADEIANQISFGLGRKNTAKDAPVDHPLFFSAAWDAIPAAHREPLRSKARQQLGTVGSGNHYVDIFADEEDYLWVGVHFGSRGLGHTIASGFLALGQGAHWGQRVPEREVLLPLDAELGQRYWALMELAGHYAYAGREWVARKVVNDILGAQETDLVHNHHNFGWVEEHDGQEFIVVRKGATPAFPGQRGFVGGSMGDDAVILQGTAEGTEETQLVQQAALYSTVHGAGRVMSRSAAKGSRRKQGRQARAGLISREMMRDWTQRSGVVVRGGDVDESPHVYRRLPDVLAAQGPTVEVLHTLRPLVVVMAGAGEIDPYKD